MNDDAAVDDRRPNPRIVSLLPSITEILCEIGLSKHIVGITHECDHPADLVSSGGVEVVTASDVDPRAMTQAEIHEAVCGSLKNGQSLYGIDKDALRSVRPDIIFTQSLCDVCAVSYPVVIDTCAKLLGGGDVLGSGDSCPAPSSGDYLDPNIISVEPEDLHDCLKTFHMVANAIGDPKVIVRAQEVTSDIERCLEKIREAVKGLPKHRVAFLEWHDPIFCGGHWIVDMVDIAGCEYGMPVKPRGRSEAMSNEDFVDMDPDVILIGPCGFSLDRTIKDTVNICGAKEWWRSLRAVKEGRVFALDGNSYFSRPGPRLFQGAGLMAVCVHGQEVAARLGRELAPPSGYCQIKPTMYEQTNMPSFLSEVLTATPPISTCVLHPHPICSLFVAWNGVIVLVYEGFPPSLALAKDRINNFLPDLKEENFGSKWPKSTVGAVNDDVCPFSLEELTKLRSICGAYSKRINLASVGVRVKTLSVVEYNSRSLESLKKRVDIDIKWNETYEPIAEKEKTMADGVVVEWDDLEAYLPKVNAPGSRIGSYREDSSRGSTCVAFLDPLPRQLSDILNEFRSAVDEALPGRYSWLDEAAIHCTLRSLD